MSTAPSSISVARRELGASEDEIWETVVYAMRPVAANVRSFAEAIIAK